MYVNSVILQFYLLKFNIRVVSMNNIYHGSLSRGQSGITRHNEAFFRTSRSP